MSKYFQLAEMQCSIDLSVKPTNKLYDLYFPLNAQKRRLKRRRVGRLPAGQLMSTILLFYLRMPRVCISKSTLSHMKCRVQD